MKFENREIVRLCHEQINNGNFEAALEFIAEEASNHGKKVGKAGYKKIWSDIYKTFPDCRFETEDIVEAGDSVIVGAKVRGKHPVMKITEKAGTKKKLRKFITR